MSGCLLSFPFRLFLLCILSRCAWGEIDCLIDSEIGWTVPTNIYQCEDNAKCCKEYGNPSCCAEKDKGQIVRDQAILWGGLLGFLTVLGLIVYFRRSDFYVMESTLFKKGCCCKSSKNKHLEESKENQAMNN